MNQRLGCEAEFRDHRIESAGFAAMTPERVLDVERGGREALGHSFYLRGRDIQKNRRGIDKAADEPWAGDAVDLGPRACHPDRTAACVAAWKTRLGHERQLRRGPGFEAAVE